MARETRAEIIVVIAAGAFLLMIWGRNRAAGAGTGLEFLPSLTPAAATPATAAPGFAIPAAVPGWAGAYDQAPVALPAADSFTMAAGMPSSCDCASSSQLSNTFGSSADLAAWLAAQPGILAPYREAGSWY